MDLSKPLSRISALYSDNLERNGPVSTAVGWNTPESQRLRFEKLTSVVEADAAPFSVNDYGCGYGAHLDHLLERGMRVSAYHGYDLSEKMLDTARARLAGFQGELDLRQSATVETEADYTFVSGTFNVRFEASEEEWKRFILAKLDEMHRQSRKGFAFNLLSTYVDWQEPHLFYGDPLFWFDHCKRNYSRKVSLLHDYPLYEWTIVVRI
ncbi:MAG: methyltransferase domain-containing protein [Hydrogenophaga sp.]|uniref:class I SAM-dependent methyltransferase n=1 Tax=Hydrogenophaga sp. TaxID=1904254 RepID=UPI0016B7AAF1|nr:class I SAM-dependent methyltransferase [Hydrogenophaga sp.]NIM39994.1 methyltransferase domain-containing protein [Hydrogenophaga sp.]NIN25190.1 methyltransferase domain-containing protein [Hydrogenophaga sp.]NIN29757.1 methyltransferase domain-containing protein [Hydrogenophaga sp.]NIN54229.1 methyltransferase domain-containing protein [Hydrogenophaga sp.]NIO50642.1 methyltransferase domain-containing protein [Hydrogenophaga sp.]